MRNRKRNVLPTTDEVAAIMLLKKQVIRAMEWSDKQSSRTPQWRQFESFCIVGSEESEEVIFRALYRPHGNLIRGSTVIPLPEICNLSLCWFEHRIFGIDLDPTSHHKNKVGQGRKFYRKFVKSDVHIHIWTEEGYGYVEPLDVKIRDVEELFDEFLKRDVLYLNGEFLHPMQGTQYLLL